MTKKNCCLMGLYPYVHLPVMAKVIMQGKLFQWCTHILYCYVLSLGGKMDIEPVMGSILSKLSKFNAFHLFWYWMNIDASILVYKFRPERTGFNMYAEYTQLQFTFLATLIMANERIKNKTTNVPRPNRSKISMIVLILYNTKTLSYL